VKLVHEAMQAQQGPVWEMGPCPLA